MQLHSRIMRFQISAKTNAVALVSLLVMLGISVFHAARLPMRPFGLDPCDAVAHFAFLTLLLITGTSLIRAFLPRMIGPKSSEEHLYINRSQQAFVIAVPPGSQQPWLIWHVTLLCGSTLPLGVKCSHGLPRTPPLPL